MPRRRAEPKGDVGRIIVGLILLGGFGFTYFVTRAFPQLNQYGWQITAACFAVGVIVLVVGGLAVLPVLTKRRREIESRRAQANLLYRQLVDLSPTEFEQAMCRLFEMNGFTVEHVGQRGDGGVDMRMQRKGLKFIGQCKRYEKNPVTVEQVRDFYGALTDSGADQGYFITTSRFTKPALEWAEHKQLTLIDGPMLKKQIADQAGRVQEQSGQTKNSRK